MEQHYILCGLGRVGWRVLQYLQAAGAPVVVVDNRCAPEEPRLAGIPLIQGDCRMAEVLTRAGVERARAVLILTSDDLVSLSAALMVRHLNPSVRVVVRMFNPNLIARLGSANVFALSTSALTAPVLALTACTGEALGVFRVAGGVSRQVAEVQIVESSPLRGQKICEVEKQHQVQAVGHFPVAGEKKYLDEIDPDTKLNSRDRLVVCAEPTRLKPLLAQGENESLPELLWAGFLRRWGRTFWQTLSEIDLPVKICTSVLFAVILVSVLVFYFGTARDTLIDAFYRTISLMATGADLGGQEFTPGAWQKAFISFLRLFGAAVTAAFTAILTNYLVRAHLGGALEVRRIPDSGHIIICGLGNVGFRVLEELLHLNERVVVIERARDNPFIPTARRQGVAVIIGDATVTEVLQQAHGEAAKAVVAATSNELVNLEIALLAKQLNFQQRVVVRLTDPNLARTLREAANVKLALSIPELSAPAFVAALFGDRVRSIFLVEDRLLAAVDLVVQAGAPFFEGRSIRSLAADVKFLPVNWKSGNENSKPLDPDAWLAPGDCLTAIISLGDLQRLFGREKVGRLP